MSQRNTSWDQRVGNSRLEHTLRHGAAQPNMRILELENRCTGNLNLPDCGHYSEADIRFGEQNAR